MRASSRRRRELTRSSSQRRIGLTFPLEGEPLAEQADFVHELAARGYTDLWTSEAQDLDGLVPLALAAQWAPELRLGTAILPVQTRGPAVLAMSAAALAEAAPGRCVIGLGSSSEWIVRFQNARPYERPFHATRDTVRFLRTALAGGDPSGEYDTFSVRGFKLHRKLATPPKLMVAALRPGMLAMAGRESDGAILNWVTPRDVEKSAAVVRAQGSDKELVARIYVCPTTDAEPVRRFARRSMAPYLSVPTYRLHQEWLGNETYYAEMWKRWAEGDVRGAREAISDEACDRLFIHGTPEYCRARIEEYFDAGLDTVILGLVEETMPPREQIRLLAPE
jgi:probable F420-dependent oxidoreductase